MISEKFIFLSVILNLVGSATYAYNTIKGRTKPNRVTWFLWALAPLIAFAAQLSEGVQWQSVMTFMVGFGPLLIFISSFVNKDAFWKISKLDIFCGLVSVCALILWAITGAGLLAIALSIFADLVAGIPTLIKSYKDPESEHPSVFRNGALSALIILLTIDDWYFGVYGFALYILIICGVLYGLVRFKIGPRISKHA